MPDRLVLYDTTLRDGTQQAGISLSVRDKLRIASKLIEFGIDWVEGGWPGSNPKDAEFFREAPDQLPRERLVAFGSTRRAHQTASDDPQLHALVEAALPTVTVFGKCSRFQAETILGVDAKENLSMIEDSVAYLTGQNCTVIFDAEHFFDGLHADEEYALKCLEAARHGGAQWLVLCDTNGGSLPSQVARGTRVAREHVPGPRLGIHAHNDSGLAVANSLAAVESGARMVQGTMNGYGERCGNADLVQVLPALVLKMGFSVRAADRLADLTHLARFVAEVTNLPLAAGHPYVGTNAFTHKAGVHAAAVVKDRRAYEHIDPCKVGAERRILTSELSGRSNLRDALSHLPLTSESIAHLLSEVKEREHRGYRYEDAEASLELLARRRLGDEPPLSLTHYRVMTDGSEERAEATAEVTVANRKSHAAGYGNGPVAALDAAVRRALAAFYPDLARIRLVDYRVRVIDGTDGASAQVRVWAEFTDGTRLWRTVGVSSNVVAASAEALMAGFQYGLVLSAGPAPAITEATPNG